MSKHLSDEQLLNEQFKLSDPLESQRVQEHLGECSECTRRAGELTARFTALDELKDQPEVSEQRIADILRAVRKSKPESRSYPLLTRALWFATPAAALVFLVMVFMPTQSGMPPEVREMIATRSVEQAAEPRVVRLARSMGAAGQSMRTRPLLGKTAVMVIAKATPTFQRRQWVGDEVLPPAPEAVEAEMDTQPMLAMKGLYAGRSVSGKKMSRTRRGSALVAGAMVDSTAQEKGLMEMKDEREAPMELAGMSAPAASAILYKEAHELDDESRFEVKPDTSADADVPMDRIFRSERETEEWKSMGEQSPVRILSKPVGAVGSNKTVTAWQVTVQNLSGQPVDVSFSRPLLRRDWSVNVADKDVLIQPADENSIRFALTVDPRATKTFVYELHPALPASGGVVENAKEKESEQ